MSGSNVSVPKFASFRPRKSDKAVEAPSAIPNLALGEVESQDIESKNLHHSGRHGERSHDQGRVEVRRRSKERHVDSSAVTRDNFSKLTTSSDLSQAFVVERTGDRQNLVYGHIHRYDVPLFHRIGSGSVLGAPRFLKIDRNLSTDSSDGLILQARQGHISGKREKYVFAQNEKKGFKLIRVIPQEVHGDDPSNGLDYVPLGIPSKRRKLRHGSETISDEDSQAYRSIEGKAKILKHPEDPSLEYLTYSESSDEGTGRRDHHDTDLRNKTVRLSRNVDRNPQDIHAWLDLINHQDVLLARSHGRRKMTNAELRSTTDLKIHLYEKALAKVVDSFRNRERLILGMMTEGAKIWDVKTRSERWEQIARDNFSSFTIWKHYVGFRQSMLPTFQYEEITEIFQAQIRSLKSASSGIEEQDPKMITFYASLFYTILRVTLYMREAGFTEIAVGIWQGLLELNLRSPASTAVGKPRLQSLQGFWEAEMLRIGEEGSRGWNAFVDSAEHGEIPKERVDMVHPKNASNDMFLSWSQGEMFLDASSREPARIQDEVREDDPYRVILWSDIEPYLIELPSNGSYIELRHLLVNAFLIFCRLPPLIDIDGSSSNEWGKDPFLRGDVINWTTSDIARGHGIYTDNALDIVTNYGDHQMSVSSCTNVATSLDTLYPLKQDSGAFLEWKLASKRSLKSGNVTTPDTVPLTYAWVSNALKVLSETFPTAAVAEYRLAFEFSIKPEGTKKIAKELIKQRPGSLRLYNAYALTEICRGNQEIAYNVLAAALNINSSIIPDEEDHSIILWRTWAWALLDAEENEQSFKCLLSTGSRNAEVMADLDIRSPAVLLKAHQYLSSLRDISLSAGRLNHAICCVELKALLEYLRPLGNAIFTPNRQGDIISSIKVLENFSETMISRGHGESSAHEILFQMAARLLVHHIQLGPFRPAFLRKHLEGALSRFPGNSILLSVYAFNERRLRIDDRVRTIVREKVITPKSDCLTSRLFAIRYELQHGNVHSAHSAFESAVTSANCCSNPGLWRLYVNFCLATNANEYRTTAKDIFYRGMRACPWAKRFYMIAFSEDVLRRMLGFDGLKAVYRALGEKGLRVHIDLEDDFEEVDEKMKGRHKV